MPRMKNDDLDIKGLEDAEWDDRESYFEPYDGPEPPVGTILPGYIKRMWWTESQNGDRMITSIFVADETAGKYEGCPIWDHVVLLPQVKFRWQPLLNALGITLRDVRNKMFVEPEDDNQGAPVEHIADFYPGEDQDSAYLRVVTKREKFEDEWQTKVQRWLPYEPPEDEDEPEDEPEETPSRGSRSRRATNGSRATTRSRRQAEPEPEDEGDGDEEPEEKPARGARRAGGRSTGARATTASRARGKTATAQADGRRGGRRRTTGDDEPPF